MPHLTSPGLPNGTNGWRRLDAPPPDYIAVTGLSSKGNASTGAAPTSDCDGHTKSHAVNALFLRELPRRATCVTESYRAQRLAEMLASIAEYRAASPAFRHFWRKLALHDIARFKREFIQPERAAFLAAVERQQATMFRDHRCWKCHSGQQRCVQGSPNQCEYPMARSH